MFNKKLKEAKKRDFLEFSSQLKPVQFSVSVREKLESARLVLVVSHEKSVEEHHHHTGFHPSTDRRQRGSSQPVSQISQIRAVWVLKRFEESAL